MRREWLRDQDEPTEETAVLQVVDGGYSAYMAGDLWSFVSSGRENFGYRVSTGVDKSWWVVDFERTSGTRSVPKSLKLQVTKSFPE